jgi:chemotaxis response regulator CheB
MERRDIVVIGASAGGMTALVNLVKTFLQICRRQFSSFGTLPPTATTFCPQFLRELASCQRL